MQGMNQEKEFETNSSNPRVVAHAKIFYLQIFFTICTFILGSRALLTSYIPFFAWLPALLLLFDATLSFASLLYLDFTRENTTNYLRLVLSLVILRFSCAVILVAELFLPHSDPSISIPLVLLSIIHCIFSLLSSVTVYNLTSSNRDKSTFCESEEGLKMEPCLGSTSTLVTNIEDDFI